LDSINSFYHKRQFLCFLPGTADHDMTTPQPLVYHFVQRMKGVAHGKSKVGFCWQRGWILIMMSVFPALFEFTSNKK